MIREVKREDIPECVEVIKKSFQTVAEDFGLTAQNAPRFTAFAPPKNDYTGILMANTGQCMCFMIMK